MCFVKLTIIFLLSYGYPNIFYNAKTVPATSHDQLQEQQFYLQQLLRKDFKI